ncbi:MAG: BACON domain-containing carbohydrate-binding protein [Gemmatimonadota bacterium]
MTTMLARRLTLVAVACGVFTTCSNPENPERPPQLVLSASTLSFATPAGTDPAAQSVSISNGGGGTLTWSASANQAWLTLAPASGTGAGTLNVLVFVFGLATGVHTGTITVSATGIASQTVSVTLAVTQPPTIGLSTTSLTFNAVAGGANPASQTVSLTNTGGSTLAWSAISNNSWLSAQAASGTAPATLTVSATTGSLVAATYNGSITVTGTGATNSPQTISVTFIVATPPAIGLSTTTLAFNGNTGAASPADQTVTVSNSGGGTLSWTASDDASWLTVAPTSGGAPSTITVSVNTTGLAAGTYTGTITVSATGASNTPRTIGVTLTMSTSNYNGSWSGKTSQSDSAITLSISSNAVSQISFGWQAINCGASGRTTVTYTTQPSVAAGTLSSTINSSPLSFTIAGTFSSNTSVAGTLTLSYSQIGGGCTQSNMAVTWSATRP